MVAAATPSLHAIHTGRGLKDLADPSLGSTLPLQTQGAHEPGK